MKSIFLLPEFSFKLVFNQDITQQIQSITENDGQLHTRESILNNPAAYQDVEIAFSSWGCPELDSELLDALPSLKALFYAAGSTRSFITDAFWERDILLTSAYQMNAIPVAEFTQAAITLSLKRFWHYMTALHNREHGDKHESIPGIYHGTRVGIISLGAIGQLVCQKLSHLDLDVLAYDPFASDDIFEACGAVKSESLEELFQSCDVVSLHTPWLPSTENMITGDHLRSMRHGTTFINTSRGMVVDEPAMIEVLRERPDLTALLDVIRDEANRDSSPLNQLPNAILTPHIAGSKGRECFRMGAESLNECKRFLDGHPPITPVTKEKMALIA
ncbi:MAG: hydroxyacid dehydrogenase [Puniceicoccales bacterium]